VGPLSPWSGHTQVADGEDGLQIWQLLWIYWNKMLQTDSAIGPPALMPYQGFFSIILVNYVFT